MRINPVQGGEPATADLAEARTVRVPAAPAVPGGADVPVPPPSSGTSQKPKVPSPQDSAASSASPQDEVEVQRDNGTNGEIVIKYLDRHGEVILQVPTSQVLKVAHAIEQNLEPNGTATASPESKQEELGGH